MSLDAAPLADGRIYRLRWGAQVDTRAITGTADRDGHRGMVVHPEQVASYLAKYLTKATEDFGLPARVLSAAHARATGASPHAVPIIATARTSPPRTRRTGCCSPTSAPWDTAATRSPSPAHTP